MSLELYRPDAPRIPGKMGKLAPTFPTTLPYFVSYLPGGLPAAPPSVQREQFVNVVWGMLGNDQYGDCTFAGYAHAAMAIATLLGVTLTPPQAAAVVQAYLTFDHGQDVGCQEATVLQAGYAAGICTLKLAGYGKGKGGIDEAEQFVATFGVSYDGVMLTQSDMTQFSEGQPWHLTPGTKTIIGGHCVIRAEYDRPTGMFKIVTWGVEHLVEYEWYEARCDEQWALIPSQVKEAGTLDGIAWAELEADLHSLLQPVG